MLFIDHEDEDVVVALTVTILLEEVLVPRGAGNGIAAHAAEEIGVVDGPFAKLRAKYEELSPKGKMAAGATVGFVGSRLALNTVTKVAKIGAAAFIT